ncbi:MAG: hypothetical protein AAF517_14645, partial [Planctomycetota bacterium]
MATERDESFRRLHDLFRDLTARPMAERAAALDEACAEDDPLRKRLEKMLLADQHGSTFLDTVTSKRLAEELPAVDTAEVQSHFIGRCIGGFEIVRVIGTGGMGTVYEAIQANPRRSIALKVLSPDLASSEAKRRIEQEAQVLALLRHQGVAQIYDCG